MKDRVELELEEWDGEIVVSDSELTSSAWTKAREKFLQYPDLSSEERGLLENSTAETVREDLRRLEAKHAESSRGRRLVSKLRLKPLLDGLQNLDDVLKAAAVMDPHHIAPLVWGGISVMCKVLQGNLQVHDDTLDFLRSAGGTLGRLQLYEKLSGRAYRLSRILYNVFVTYLNMCFYVRNYYIKDGAPRSVWKTSMKLTAEGFKKTMTSKIADMHKLCEEAYKEAQLAVIATQLNRGFSSQRAIDDLADWEKMRYESGLQQQRVEKFQASKARFLKWLRQVPTEEDFQELRSLKLEGTCEWIDQDPYILPWLYQQGNDHLLWISGGPGTGKSVLAAHIVSRLQGSRPTAYFFCKSGDERKRTTMAILQTWIWQLVHRSPVLPEEVTRASDEYQSPTVSVLATLLQVLQQQLKRSWLVVDGLDECDGDLRTFLQCCGALSKEWYILIVSRDVPSVREGLRGYRLGHKAMTTKDNEADINDYLLHKFVTIQDTKGDMEALIAEKTHDLAMAKGWQTMQQTIAKILSTNAEGMFLWVRLVLDFLFDFATQEDGVREALNSIPSNLMDFYDKILQKMTSHPSHKKMTLLVLQWILHALRPLTVEELGTAISCQLSPSTPIKDFEEVLRKSCGLFIRIDEGSRQVTLMHATVKEYLLRVSEDWLSSLSNPDLAHARMSKICMDYLRHTLPVIHFHKGPVVSERRFQNHLQTPPNSFLEYSAIHWIQHIARSTEQSAEWNSSLCELTSKEHILVGWLQVFHYFHMSAKPGTLETERLVHNALLPSSTLHDNFFKRRLQQVQYKSFRSHLGLGDGRRFLRWDRFIRGASDSTECFPYVLVAAHFDFVNIVRKEISTGRADIKTGSTNGDTILVWTARGDSVSTLKYLLSQMTRLSDQSLRLPQSALTEAMSLEKNLEYMGPGLYPVVPVLLAAGIDVDLKDQKNQWTALNVLIDEARCDDDGETILAEQLLRHKSDIWEFDHALVGSPLRHAVSKGLPRIAETILNEIRRQQPSNPTTLLERIYEGDTVLHSALQYHGHNKNLIAILLDQGALPDTPDRVGILPIQYAAQLDLGGAIVELVSHGANVHAHGRLNKSPLVIALEHQSENAIKELLSLGADVSTIPDTVLRLPGSIPLDERIKVRKCSAAPPVCPRDIYQICFHFRERHLIPIPLTARILDIAELWVQSSVFRDDKISFENTISSPIYRKLYLRSAPIIGRNQCPIQKIVFTVMSHDQGYDDNPPPHTSWTWFDSVILTGQEAEQGERWLSSAHIVSNRRAESEWYTHVSTWSQATIHGHPWNELKPGFRIGVLAQAQWKGWINYVGMMRIDVYTSILRQHYTEDEISDIWGERTLADRTGVKKGDAVKLPTQRSALLLERLSLDRALSDQRTGIVVLAANYGGLNVKDHLTKLVSTDEQSLILDIALLQSYFTDPWTGAKKPLSAIYRYGNGDQGLRLLIAKEYTARTTIKPETMPPSASDMCLAKRLEQWSPDAQILAIIYGETLINSQKVYKNIQAAITRRGEYLVHGDDLSLETGADYYIQKLCAVYYLPNQHGPVHCISAREHDYLRF